MPRIKIEIPEKILGKVSIPIRITDLNYGNHVGNDSFVSLIHEARSQWLRQHDFTELDAGGVSLIMGDLAVEFKKESKYGDVIDFTISAAEITTVSFELYYSATNQNGELVLRAKTGMVCYDYTAKKLSQVTETLRAILE